jgi:purine catabolism regulator
VANSLVFLISPAAGDDRAKRMDSFYETVRQISSEINSVSHDPVSIAAGGFRDNILNVGESYMEAQRALKVLRTYSLDDNIAIWDRLGSYKLLSTLDTYSEASQFFLRELGPLLDYDRQHNSDLLETLYAIDRNNWNLSSTASEINVHYNTMKYRYKNIAEFLSVDLEDSENRFNIALALRLYKMSRA